MGPKLHITPVRQLLQSIEAPSPEGEEFTTIPESDSKDTWEGVMRQGQPVKAMHVRRPPGDPTMLEGDLLVTAVGKHYALGRLKADRDTQEHLGWQLDRTEAVKQACALAGANHRVFLYANAGTPYYLPFDCAEVSK